MFRTRSGWLRVRVTRTRCTRIRARSRSTIRVGFWISWIRPSKSERIFWWPTVRRSNLTLFKISEWFIRSHWARSTRRTSTLRVVRGSRRGLLFQFRSNHVRQLLNLSVQLLLILHLKESNILYRNLIRRNVIKLLKNFGLSTSGQRIW